MNLNFDFLDEKLEIGQSTILVLEDVNVFAKVVQGFYQYTGENDFLKIFDNKQKNIKPNEMILISDILGFDINTRSNLKLIYQDLEEQLNDKPDVKSKIERLKIELANLISHELVEHELDLVGDKITFQELFLALGIHIEVMDDTIFEKASEILHIYKYLSRMKLLVFINCASYLNFNELEQIFEYVELNNKPVLFVEPRKIHGFIQHILDEDYFLSCENVV